jgi:hypothetical protein
MPELLHIGLDTLELTATAPVQLDIITQLAENKALAAQSKDGFRVADLGFGPVAVDARGLRHYSYCFRSNTCTCYVSAGQSQFFPQIKITYGSLICQQQSISELVWYARHMVLMLTGQSAELKICRVDVCADWAMPVADIEVPSSDYFIFTGKCDFSPHYTGPHYTGWHVTNGNVMFRVYDKLCEIQRNQRDQAKRLYYQTVYSGYEAVTRFELEIRGEYVRRFGLTVHNLEQLHKQVYASMCSTWLCLYDRPVARDGNNSKQRQARHLHPLWRLQQQVAETIPRKKKKDFTVRDEEEQISSRRRYHLQRAMTASLGYVFVPVRPDHSQDLAAAYYDAQCWLADQYHAAMRRLDEEYERYRLDAAADPDRLVQANATQMLPF